jgi:hypothetical protein
MHEKFIWPKLTAMLPNKLRAGLAVQLKTPVLRRQAPHVQAALASCLQPKLPSPPAHGLPAPHVQAALVQTRAATGDVSAVQRHSRILLPPAPTFAAPGKPGVLQRSFNNLQQLDEYLKKQGFNLDGDSDSDDENDEDWDPAVHATDRAVYEDFNISALRKGLSWTQEALYWIKQDSKDMGKYICSVCNRSIKKKHKTHRDHHPPWKRRVEAYLELKEVVYDDFVDDFATRKWLFNLRGSRLSHASCNLGHSGEGQWSLKKTKQWLENFL